MLKNKVDLTAAEKEAREIARRRALEESRRPRILEQPKQLKIGIDVQALEEQVAERKERERLEKARSEAFDSAVVVLDHQLTQLQQERLRIKREMAMAENEFRATFQRKELRKEYDLSDPQALLRDKPARVGDNDPRLGPATLQKFAGEDLSAKAREVQQKEQQRIWLETQVAEREARRAAEKEADMAYYAHMEDVDAKRGEIEDTHKNVRREILSATARYNLALADTKRDADRAAAERDAAERLEEIRNALDSDILNENPAQAMSHMAPGRRVRRDHFKGMAPEQVETIRNIQEVQREENRLKKTAEQAEEAWWAMENEHINATLVAADAEVTRLRRMQKMALSEVHRAQSREHMMSERHLKRDVYINPPTAAYFAQFQTTTR
eukprot:tig00000076_g2389.t1